MTSCSSVKGGGGDGWHFNPQAVLSHLDVVAREVEPQQLGQVPETWMSDTCCYISDPT